MSHYSDQEVCRAVIGIIAETFGIDPDRVTRQTTAEEVDGWDSLGHSIVMTRLARKLGLPIGEDIAATVQSVGELIDRVSQLKAEIGRAHT